MDADELYQDLIVDHFKHPRFRGQLTDPTVESSLVNPLCGDRIDLDLKIARDQIQDAAFQSKGCAISQAAASMMVDLCRGQKVETARRFLSAFTELMQGKRAPAQCSELKDALALEGVRKFSARIRCAMLPWEALEQCLEKTQDS